MLATSAHGKAFTLIEVLIAMLVIGFGMLGLIALQTRSMAGTHAAYYRSQASTLAYDMADRVRANPVQATAGAFHHLAASKNNNCLNATGCSSLQMAQNDLWLWNDDVSNELPAGSGIVCRDSTPEDGSRGNALCDGAGLYTVKLWWDDNKDGADERFVLSFQS